MLDQVFRPGRRRFILNRIRANPLGEEFETFAQYLLDLRHSRETILQYLQSIEHLGTWLGAEGIPTASLDERVVASFLKNHLRRCSCSGPASRTVHSLRASARHFLCSLRQRGRIPQVVARSSTPIDLAIEEFDRHLVETCGLAINTRIYRRRYVRQFLQRRFGRGCFQPCKLKARDLMDFIAGRARECKPGSVMVIAASLRSYLRFLAMRGLCHVALMRSVPTVPYWRLSQIPKTMPKEDLRRFLSSPDRSTAKGRRDYAMALCLADLGLRASEVAELRLQDIDWREASMQIVGSKTRRERVLPLPKRLAKAIADYLRRGRPKTIERCLFLTHRTRPGLPVDASMVRNAMKGTYKRSGAKTPWAGPHVLRHTVATSMLERGAKMKDLADVLGHGSIDTAAIYAKVNLRMLSHVAMPWPEVRS